LPHRIELREDQVNSKSRCHSDKDKERGAKDKPRESSRTGVTADAGDAKRKHEDTDAGHDGSGRREFWLHP
jgi:hypothetical protein